MKWVLNISINENLALKKFSSNFDKNRPRTENKFLRQELFPDIRKNQNSKEFFDDVICGWFIMCRLKKMKLVLGSKWVTQKHYGTMLFWYYSRLVQYNIKHDDKQSWHKLSLDVLKIILVHFKQATGS